MRQQPVCVPLPDRQTDFPGQRDSDAAPGSKTDRTAESEISRPETHICHGSPAKWGGHQDGLRDAGALQCGLHAGHLRPRDHGGTAGGGENHGQRPLWCSLALSGRFPVWVKKWVKNREQNQPPEKVIKQGKPSDFKRNQRVSGCGDRT